MSSPKSLRIIQEEHHALRAMLQSLHLMIKQGPEQNSGRFFHVIRPMLFYIDQYPERLVRQQSWQEIVNESLILIRNGESIRPRVMRYTS